MCDKAKRFLKDNDCDLSHGSCLSSQTYGLASDLGPASFEVACAQLWDLTPLDELEDGGSADADSVLTSHKADALLLPFLKGRISS